MKTITTSDINFSDIVVINGIPFMCFYDRFNVMVLEIELKHVQETILRHVMKNNTHEKPEAYRPKAVKSNQERIVSLAQGVDGESESDSENE